jgi:hypothetical protein
MIKNIISLKACLLLCMIGGGLHAQEARLIEVTDELSCDAAPTVFIGNIIRRVTVRTTHENKVRLVTTVAYEGKSGYTNEDWLNKLELKVSGNAGYVNVKCGNMQPIWSSPGRDASNRPPRRRILDNLTPNGTVVFDSDGHWRYKKGNIRRDIVIYVPMGSKLELDSRYAEIILDSNVREVNARITSGGLTMKDAGRLILNSTYGSVYSGNIGHAEVKLNHGWFHAKDIFTLDFESKVSTVELGAIGKLKINSNGDQYDLDEAGTIDGEKNYGSLRVVTLKSSLDLTGVNADITVHNIEPDVTLVKIDGQYANLRLPVDNLKNYTVHFEGSGSNVYTPFERPPSTDGSFIVRVGTGKKNSFQLKCSNCNLDMK